MTHTQPEQELSRYNSRSIKRSEEMYGTGWQSPGGEEIVASFASRLQVGPGKSVMDIGSGLGGALFYLAKEHQMNCLGVDYSQVMVDLSTKKSIENGLSDKVKFRQGDITEVNLERNAVDLVWSRDAILYIQDKEAVFANAYKTIKSGGELFVTDFLRGDRELSPEFKGYLKDCAYHLDTFSDYQRTLADAGFTNIRRENVTPDFIRTLRNDRVRLEAKKDDFLTRFNIDDFSYLMDRWQGKIDMCEAGELQWGLFVADKK
ncbi:methyltransferase domain-containing protein [archaeon]|mgnify:CR=1 FL=1|jgi:phosphoethanolamine N-methyltransferase|nr:methyltransferase domain-containing protein [archaeon]MBT6762659.1 methyltransferase domain-containing protein [archaeon]